MNTTENKTFDTDFMNNPPRHILPNFHIYIHYLYYSSIFIEYHATTSTALFNNSQYVRLNKKGRYIVMKKLSFALYASFCLAACSNTPRKNLQPIHSPHR